jgi:hypothetical protein
LSQPIFAHQKFTVAGSPSNGGRKADLWVKNEDGLLAAEGHLEYR